MFKAFLRDLDTLWGSKSSMSSLPYKHLVVIGVTGSGKSTLAEKLAQRFDLKYIDLDALYWRPNWQPTPRDVFRLQVQEALQCERWTVSGNYRMVRDLVWTQAEALIWLDYSLGRVLWQLTRRTFRRWWTRELLWGTNYEPLLTHFKLWSKDSLYNWLLQTYWRRKREIPELLSMPEHQHLKLLWFRQPSDAEKWLEEA